MSIRLILKLKKGSSPHLYITDILDLIKTDGYLSKPMELTLKILRKKRQSFIMLPTKHEIIIDEKRQINIERGLEPVKLTYIVAPWTEKDKIDYKANKEDFFRKIKEVYCHKMGYFIDEEDNVSDKEVSEILKSIKYREDKK